MKKKASASAVGRKLRRSLGSLLALGFGATWWSFAPASVAAAAAMVTTSTPESLSISSTTTVSDPRPPAPLVAARTPRRHPRPHVLRPPLPPDGDPPPIVALLPVIEPQPIGDLPEIPKPPEREPVDREPVDLPPITTRSS